MLKRRMRVLRTELVQHRGHRDLSRLPDDGRADRAGTRWGPRRDGKKTDEVPVHFPGTTEGGEQRWPVIATYKTEEDVRRFWKHPRNYDNKHLREQGTKDYVWALYEGADIFKTH
jgi:hypothetical protein